MDVNNNVVHQWKTSYRARSLRFLPDGSLVRSVRIPRGTAPGQSGAIQRHALDGTLLWDWRYDVPGVLVHHDISVLPNGNVLLIAKHDQTRAAAIAAGRNPNTFSQVFSPEKIIEVKPTGLTTGTSVWEWNAWDHLVQNDNEDAANYGDPAANPQLIDINGTGEAVEISDEELAQLQALGYVPEDAEAEDLSSDIFHTNAIHYNAALDQIVLSVPEYNEIWIIDHSTTTEEAAGSTGGRWGHGGDLLYRWGNPRVYSRGTAEDQQLGYQHDVRWIPAGYPGAGNLTIFNNDVPAEDGNYSRVVEIAPPMGGSGYDLSEGEPFEPAEPVWAYSAAAATPAVRKVARG